MRIIDKLIGTSLRTIIIIMLIGTCLIFYNEYLNRKGFRSDRIIKLEPGYKIINIYEKADYMTNYVTIHAKNVKNEDVLITYRIENRSKNAELVHKIIVKEDK